MVEGDGCDDPALAAVGGGEAEILDRALGEDDLIAEGAHADAFDVDAELAGPKLRQRQVWAATGLGLTMLFAAVWAPSTAASTCSMDMN